jgi:hypothetical protein
MTLAMLVAGEPSFTDDRLILPRASTPWEMAIDQTAQTFSPLPVPNAAIWNPDTCPEHMLSWLAVNLSVDLWRADWPVWKKRQVCREAIELARVKGTRAALERYLRQVDAQVVSVITPPVKMFAGKSYTKAELDRFYSVMPQLRVYPYRNRNRNVFGKMFAGRGVGPGRFALVSVARTGRKTFLFDPLVESLVEIRALQFEERSETQNAIEITRAIAPGKPGNSFFAGSHAGRCAGLIGKRSTVHTVEVETSYIHKEGTRRLSTIEPGLEPVLVRHERGTDKWQGRGGKAFAGRSAGKFACPSDAWLHSYTLVRLHDPSRTPALRHGARAFAGDRVGIRAHTAHVRIKVEIPHRKRTMFAGRHASRAYARPIDTRIRDAALEAVHVSKAAHEKILVSFQNWREPTFGDALTLDGKRRLGGLIPRKAS